MYLYLFLFVPLLTDISLYLSLTFTSCRLQSSSFRSRPGVAARCPAQKHPVGCGNCCVHWPWLQTDAGEIDYAVHKHNIFSSQRVSSAPTCVAFTNRVSRTPPRHHWSAQTWSGWPTCRSWFCLASCWWWRWSALWVPPSGTENTLKTPAGTCPVLVGIHTDTPITRHNIEI